MIGRPLNSVGMPLYDSFLLSANTRDLYHPSNPPFPPAPHIPAQIQSAIKTIDFIGYATLPKELRGKQNMIFGGGKALAREARFRSAKSSKVTLLYLVFKRIIILGWLELFRCCLLVKPLRDSNSLS
jgi:hypothetical protein